MNPENLKELLHVHPFLQGLSDNHVTSLAECASSVRIPEGWILMREGDLASHFYLINEGRVALEIETPSHGGVRIQTAGPGDFLGWSWFIAPFRWHFTAIAVADTHAIALDGGCVRNKCENDRDLGYFMFKRLTEVIQQRLEAMLVQVVDLYWVPSAGLS